MSEVQWIQNGTVIATNTTVQINDSRVTIPHYNESEIQLSITSATLEDAGNYTCSVTNDVNSTSDTTSIVIQGVLYMQRSKTITHPYGQPTSSVVVVVVLLFSLFVAAMCLIFLMIC